MYYDDELGVWSTTDADNVTWSDADLVDHDLMHSIIAIKCEVYDINDKIATYCPLTAVEQEHYDECIAFLRTEISEAELQEVINSAQVDWAHMALITKQLGDIDDLQPLDINLPGEDEDIDFDFAEQLHREAELERCTCFTVDYDECLVHPCTCGETGKEPCEVHPF